MEVEELGKLIKSSKKYKDISEEIIKQEVENYLKKNPKIDKRDEKIILKEIKSKLHRIHGGFRISAKKTEDYLQAEDYFGLLRTNRSTNERLDFYKEAYKEIFNITGTPRSILDLGCGLNPLSIIFMNLDLTKINYYAHDINEAEIFIINRFFKNKKIQGKAEILDLTSSENLQKLPKADICFMFKLLDILEEKGHKYAEELITKLIKKSNFIVVSFATITLGGRKMEYAARGWIERMLDRVGLRFEKLEFNNEIFYVISR
jgi:16S rRNA (guanine(1405)-N(7))-methyltransferase